MIYIFLPAYNEEIALPRVLKKFSEVMGGIPEPYRVVILDDGSVDKTSQVAKELSGQYPIEIIRHEKNMGLGMTMRDGMEYLAKISRPEDTIVTLDCDDTHEPRFLKAALQKLKEGYDVVILSRFCPGGGQEGLGLTKSLMSRGAGLFLGFFFPIKGICEYSCGYRVLSASILKKATQIFGKDFVRLTHLGFVATPEILVKFRMIGARIAESPFILHYQQKPTKSKNNAMRTIQGYFALVANFWGRTAKK